MKSQLGATQVQREPFRDFYASADILDRYAIAYLVTGASKYFGMEACDEQIMNYTPDGDVTDEFLMEYAYQYVEECVRICDCEVEAPRRLELKCK